MDIYRGYNDFVNSKESFGVIVCDEVVPVLDWEFLIVDTKFIYYKHPQPPDVTFVVQGLSRLETYSKLVTNLLRFGYVEISTWDVLDQPRVLNYISSNHIPNGQNIYLQCYTTLSGLQKCTTKFAIKVRADEWYENFSLFIAAMKNYPNKITTHNLFFRTFGQYPYHLSDHVIGGTKENLLKMFSTCKHLLESKYQLPKIPRMLIQCPEQWLTVAYMKCFYKEEELPHHITRKMITHFQVVPLPVFKDFLCTYQWNGTRYMIRGPNDIGNHSHAFAIKDINKVGM